METKQLVLQITSRFYLTVFELKHLKLWHIGDSIVQCTVFCCESSFNLCV